MRMGGVCHVDIGGFLLQSSVHPKGPMHKAAWIAVW